MNKAMVIITLVLMVSAGFAMMAADTEGAKGGSRGDDSGVTIQDGILTYSTGHYLAGQPLTTGFDPYGYNYQARKFQGSYANAYLGGAGFPPYQGNDSAYLSANPTVTAHWAWAYRDTVLHMKWNDAWMSNMDRDYDGKLDRYYGFDSYVGSGAWLTNHMWGNYTQNGTLIPWNYFVKIVAVPDDATLDSGIWYDERDREMGMTIWGQFAIIHEVENDPGAGLNGCTYNPKGPSGFGHYK